MIHPQTLRRSLALAAALGVLALVSVLLLVRRSSGGGLEGPSGTVPAGEERAAELSGLAGPPPTAGDPRPQARDAEPSPPSRAGVATSGLEVRVRSDDGRPIPGALVTLTRSGGHGPFLEASAGALGVATLPRDRLGDGADLALWCTCPGFFAEGRFLEAGERSAQSLDVVLEPAPPWQVRVVDAHGTGLAGAEVRHEALAAGSGPDEARLLGTFLRSTRSEADGAVPLAPLRGEQRLSASWDGASAAPWTGRPEPRIDLVVQRDFTVEGTVSFEGEGEAPGALRVVLTGEGPGGSETLGEHRVGDGDDGEVGSWGPAHLPVQGYERFVVRLEGEPIFPQEQVLLPHPPGEVVQVDFQLSPGETVWAIVVDERGEILREGRIEVLYQDERSRIVSRTFEVGGHPKGYIEARDLPRGVVSFVGRCPGYGASSPIAVPVPTPGGVGVSIPLQPAAGLAGRCVHGGAPVTDFVVSHWLPQVPSDDAHGDAFQGREDGTFELEDVAAGPLMVSVHAPGLAPTEPRELTVGRPGPPIVFELESPLVGRGEVVDAATGAPVADARVQPVLSWKRRASFPTGPSHRVAGDGSFEVAAFRRGESACRIEAPGYAPALVHAYSASGDRLDFGLVRLSPAQPLDVVLLAEGEPDFSPYWLALEGTTTIEGRRFSSEGALRIEGVAPGFQRLVLTGPNFDMIRIEEVLVPGEDWRVEIPLARPPTLILEVLPEPGSSEVPSVKIELDYFDSKGRFCSRILRLQDGVFVAHHVDAERVWLAIKETSSPAVLATRSFEMTGEEEQWETIPLGGFGATLRVVDPEGVPLPAVDLRVSSADNRRDFLGGKTDGSGERVVAGIPEDPVLVHLVHPMHGILVSQTVTLGKDPARVVELVLTGDATLEVQLRFPDGRAAGASASLLAAGARRLLVQDTLSNAQGLLRWEALQPGSYIVRPTDPALWSHDAIVSTEDTHRPIPVPVYRRTSLTLVLHDAEDLPLAGVPVELVSLDLGAEVQTWVAEGRVDASSPTLRTDTAGRLHLERLPEGRYAWTVSSSDGPRTGTCSILPEGSVVQITLP